MTVNSGGVSTRCLTATVTHHIAPWTTTVMSQNVRSARLGEARPSALVTSSSTVSLTKAPDVTIAPTAHHVETNARRTLTEEGADTRRA